jgi:hypothetical protein
MTAANYRAPTDLADRLSAAGIAAMIDRVGFLVSATAFSPSRESFNANTRWEKPRRAPSTATRAAQGRRGFCASCRNGRGNHVTLTNIHRFLDQLGDEARAIAIQHFRMEIDVETKYDATPVTTADRAIERRLREIR